jgi:hypothetical protein
MELRRSVVVVAGLLAYCAIRVGGARESISDSRDSRCPLVLLRDGCVLGGSGLV